ncbi:MAG: MBL fold metallo-hydrolase [Proteobacteria bacterium]|nr:MBL fold metallo-hydrolase [Pseudomonadota bacterium]
MKTRNIHPGIEMIQVGEVHSSYLIRDESLALVEAPHPNEAQELIQGLAALGVIGEMLPIPETQIHPLTDGDEIKLGRTRWQVLNTPGHARYHICLFEEKEKILFAGDSLGCLYPGAPLYIVAPAPEYDFELSLKSIAHLESLKPEMVVFTHLGPSRDKTVFEECRKQHRLWVRAIEKILKFTPDAEASEVLRLIAEDIPVVKNFPQYSGSYILNIGGIRRYLMKKANPA